MAAALHSVTSSLSEESTFISTDSREGRLYTRSLSVDSTLSDDVWITSSSRFELEPSEVEDQLKESIHRLHTAGDERKEYNKGLMRTVMLYINPLEYFNNKSKQPEDGGWEIPFQDIRDLEYIGSGGQGVITLVWMNRINGWMDGCMNGWMHGLMDGWMHGWMDA